MHDNGMTDIRGLLCIWKFKHECILTLILYIEVFYMLGIFFLINDHLQKPTISHAYPH